MENRSISETLFLYGPPGSGKSTIGRALAQALDLPFWDLDQEIENHAGMRIAEIFALEGEEGFRAREKRMLEMLVGKVKGVVALGGGVLLDEENRRRVEEDGPVIFLLARAEKLIARMQSQVGQRPLLGTDAEQSDPQSAWVARLKLLLESRAAHYASFAHQVEVSELGPQQAAWEVQKCLGRYHVRGMGTGYDVLVQDGGLEVIGEALRDRGLKGPLALVSDENVGELYAHKVAAYLQSSGYDVKTLLIPPGERHKTMETVYQLWDGLLKAGLERGSTVVALGGGVVGDLAGFAAATFLRGVAWVGVPTSLLAMVDASLGGKTGADLPQGKNLIGSFHSPRLVMADPQTLETLPEVELRAGLAEVVKTAIIGDPTLFSLCERGWDGLREALPDVIRRGMAVKIAVIQGDPFEKGQRAALNLGHTIGHALELASGYTLRHGEAVAIGLVAEARLAVSAGLADPGLPETISKTLNGLGLPTEMPVDIDRELVKQAMGVDKKKAGGEVTFALPVRIGEVHIGCRLEDLDRSLDAVLFSQKPNQEKK
jgi:shikimate kinase / 3-dehydroquinate synthase